MFSVSMAPSSIALVHTRFSQQTWLHQYILLQNKAEKYFLLSKKIDQSAVYILTSTRLKCLHAGYQ